LSRSAAALADGREEEEEEATEALEAGMEEDEVDLESAGMVTI